MVSNLSNRVLVIESFQVCTGQSGDITVFVTLPEATAFVVYVGVGGAPAFRFYSQQMKGQVHEAFRMKISTCISKGAQFTVLTMIRTLPHLNFTLEQVG